METNPMHKAVLAKLENELEVYRQYLLSLPCNEAIEHSYEYTIKKDIVIAMENSDFPEDGYKLLLSSPCLLDDIYNTFVSMEDDYMETINYSIEKEIRKAQER